MNAKATVGIIALMLLAVATAAPASACTYDRSWKWPWVEAAIRREWSDNVAQSATGKFVFIGRVLSKTDPVRTDAGKSDPNWMKDPIWTEVVQFEVTSISKGNLPKRVTVRNDTYGDCGGWRAPAIGSSAFVIADQAGGRAEFIANLIATGAEGRSLSSAFSRKGLPPKSP